MGDIRLVPILFLVCLLVSTAPAKALDMGTTTVQDLAKNRTCLMILDARSPDLFSRGHIPGASSFYWKAHTQPRESDTPFALTSPDALAAALTAMGIHQYSPVVVYGQGKEGFGGEGWAVWVLAYLGHQGPIRILKGGFNAWKAQNQPVSSTANPLPTPEATGPTITLAYQFTLNPQVLAHAPDMVPDKHQALIDTRSFFERFTQPGIPGSVNIPWRNFFDEDGTSPLPPDRLDALLQSHNIAPGQPVVYFCTGGIRSSWTWLVHTLARPGTARNFEAGTSSLP